MLTSKEKEFIAAHRLDDVNSLLLHGKRDSDLDMRKMAVQIKGWQMAVKKLPLWASTDGIVYPEHLSMEQCSSEATARYKGEVLSAYFHRPTDDPDKENHPCSDNKIKITDLTGGFGVDAAMIAKTFGNSHLTLVDHNAALCELARHNLPLLGLNDSETICADSVEWLSAMPHQDILFIDPARRDIHGRKTVAIEDCSPDICQLQDLLLAKGGVVMVKLSPMLDLKIARQQLNGLREIHIVGVDGECKELLLILSNAPSDTTESVALCCVNITGERKALFRFTYEEEERNQIRFCNQIGKYLYEPNACIMKAGGFKSLGVCYCLEKLSANSHLYTADILREDFPGRIFEVSDVIPFNRTGIKHLRSQLSKSNITVRNFPLSVAELRKRMKMEEGGSDYIFATTLSDSSRVLILCHKPNSD